MDEVNRVEVRLPGGCDAVSNFRAEATSAGETGRAVEGGDPIRSTLERWEERWKEYQSLDRIKIVERRQECHE